MENAITQASAQVVFDLQKEVFEDAKDWLLGREAEIALGFEDLGQIKGLFVAVIGREPSPRA